MASWTQHPQWHEGHLFILDPQTVYAAQAHADTVTYGRWQSTDIWHLIKPYNVTAGTLADIEDGMTLLLGSSAGGRDFGIARVKGVVTDPTLGDCIEVWVSQGTGDGELAVAADAYITVLDDFRVWAKIPHMRSDGTILKDGTRTYLDNTPPPPVANAGVGYAGEMDAATGQATVQHDGSGSFAVAQGATIAGYLWEIGDGTLVSGAVTDPAITVAYPPGFRWAKLTVTDSNGKSSVQRVPVAVTGDTVTYNEVSYVGATATASSSKLSNPPECAFDGIDSGCDFPWWASFKELIGAWLAIEFPSAQTISKVGFVSSGIKNNSVRDCTIEADTTGDGNFDTVVATFSDCPGDSEENVVVLEPPITAIAWRLTVDDVNYDAPTGDGDPDSVEVREFNLYEANPPPAPEIKHFEVAQRVLRQEGQEITFRVYEDIPAEQFRYGTLVMYWEQEFYGSGEAGNLYGPAGREHMRFVGWIGEEPVRIEATDTGMRAHVELHCVDVAGRLAQLPVFPMGLLRANAPSNFDEMADLNPDRYAWFILHWHSTALELADFSWSGYLDTYAVPLLETQGDSLYSQADYMAQAMACRLTCDSRGRLAIRPDPQLRAIADRTTTVLQGIGAGDWMEIQYTETRSSRYHWLWAAAIVASTNQATDIESVVGVYCRAPGSVPGQGLQMVRRSEQVVIDQAELNTREGMRYAIRMNPDQTLFEVLIAHGNDGGIEPALMQWVQLTIPAAYAAQRGLAFTDARCLPYEVVFEYNHAARAKTARLRLEREASGPPAITYIPEQVSIPTYDEDWYSGDWQLDKPFPYLLPGELNQMAAIDSNGYLYVTVNFQATRPTWTRTNLSMDGMSDTSCQWVVDAFSPGYLNGVGAVNGWMVTNDAIYRVEDLFGSPSATKQYDFTANGRDNSAANARRMIDASFAEEGFVVVATHYNAEGGTYITRTTDGTNWSAETAINTFREGGNREHVAGVYVSSKTPGRVLCAAFTSNGDYEAASPRIFQSNDYGATWSPLSGYVLGQGLGGPFIAPWDGNAGDDILYYNHKERVGSYDQALHLYKNVSGTHTNIEPAANVGVRYDRFTIASSPQNRQRLAVIGEQASGHFGLFVSEDEGGTWMAIEPLSSGYATAVWRRVALSGDNQDIGYVWGGTGKIGYTTDYFQTIQDKSGNLGDFSDPPVGELLCIIGGVA